MQKFAAAAFELADLDWEEYVAVGERYPRPAEVDVLQGDYSRARQKLGWKPEVTFSELGEMTVESDLELAQRERTLVDAGLAAIEWLEGRPG